MISGFERRTSLGKFEICKKILFGLGVERVDLAGGEGAALGASGGLLTRLGEQHLAEVRNGQGILLAAGLLLGRADRDVVLLLRARLQLVLSVDLAKINETMPKLINL